MLLRRVPLAIFVFILSVAPALVAQKDEKKQSDAQKKEIQNIVKVVDGVAGGQPAPNDLSLAWVHEDMLKAQGNKEYVPFTVSIDPSKVAGGTLALYWRVVSKDAGAAAAAPAAPAKKDDKDKDKDKDKKKSDYAYEDITFVPVTAGQPVMRVSRSFTVNAGAYDVFVVAKEPTPDKPPKNAPPPKTSVLKQSVDVPDFWNAEQLNTSSVIIASRID